MARTKVVTRTIATPATGRTQDSQTSDVRISSDPGTGDRIEPVRQEHDEEETKYDGPGRDSDGNSSDSGIEESNTEHEQAQRVPDANQDVPSSNTDVNPDQMAAFTTFMQQMVASMVNAQLAHTAPVGTITRATTPVDVTEAPADQGRPTWTTTTRTTRRTNPPASEWAVRNQRLAPRTDDDNGGHDDSGGDDSDSDDDEDDEDGDDSDTEASDDASDTDGLGHADRRRQRRRTESRGDRAAQRNRRRMIRDLELPVLLPTSTSVSTWISRIDLALEGARLSGRVLHVGGSNWINIYANETAPGRD
ncbi:hypothetical protein PHMEG_00041320 [Phytophthora megakarya]|uniref:Uncharacterized protein n=1 Tax=Phytophthora megakarya TaxID=4795 RepID=A0A225UBZ5_9STRA|nr:hypothetical protein PHMEG_00041320 [Phytophthora megakarya]